MSTMPRYPSPDEHTVLQGGKFTFMIDRESSRHGCGDILDVNGETLWRYSRRETHTRFTRITHKNPFGKPDFEVSDPNGQCVCVIRRVSFVPSTFQIVLDDDSIGEIHPCGFLMNRYLINLPGQGLWTLRLTLFTVFFWGDNQGEPQVWIRMGLTKTEWNVLLKPSVNVMPLVFALAFIHNEWWNYR
jgi:hypothetical protein